MLAFENIITALVLSDLQSKSYRRMRATYKKMNSFFVYILQCNDGSYYVGHTENLKLRISEHNQGRYSGYTSTRLPVKLVYHEIFSLREDAFAAERKIKNWNRKKKEALINERWDLISYFAKKKFEKN